MWGGQSCPPLLTLICCFHTRVATKDVNEFRILKIKIKSGGQECPPHTSHAASAKTCRHDVSCPPEEVDMRYLLSLIVTFAFGVTALSQTTPPPAVTIIRAGVLIDGKSDQPRRDQVIVIRGNRIESVSDAANAKIPAGASTIDLSHSTVLPGLIDSHTHIFLQGEEPSQGGYDANILKSPLALRAARATVAARRALEQGFTTLRDVETEGAGYGDVGIKMAIEGGYIPGPRLFVVTRAISTTGTPISQDGSAGKRSLWWPRQGSR